MKYLSIIGLTFIITSMTSFSNKPQLGVFVAIMGALMLLIGKRDTFRNKAH